MDDTRAHETSLPPPPFHGDSIMSAVNRGIYNQKLNSSETWTYEKAQSPFKMRPMHLVMNMSPAMTSTLIKEEDCECNESDYDDYEEETDYKSSDGEGWEEFTLSTDGDDFVDESFRDELRELGLDQALLVPTSNKTIEHSNLQSDGRSDENGVSSMEKNLPNGNCSSTRSSDETNISKLSWANESFLGDLMSKRGERDKLQQDEVMEEALDRYNALPETNEYGEKKTSGILLKIIEDVQKEFEPEFQRRNDLEDERMANEVLDYAEAQRKKKLAAGKIRNQMKILAEEAADKVSQRSSVDDYTQHRSGRKSPPQYDYKLPVLGNLENQNDVSTAMKGEASRMVDDSSRSHTSSSNRRRRRPDGVISRNQQSPQSSGSSQMMSSGSQTMESRSSEMESSGKYPDIYKSASINRHEISASNHTALSMDWSAQTSLDSREKRTDEKCPESMFSDENASLSLEGTEDDDIQSSSERKELGLDNNSNLLEGTQQLSNAVAVLDGIIAHIDNSVSTHRSRGLPPTDEYASYDECKDIEHSDRAENESTEKNLKLRQSDCNQRSFGSGSDIRIFEDGSSSHIECNVSRVSDSSTSETEYRSESSASETEYRGSSVSYEEPEMNEGEDRSQVDVNPVVDRYHVDGKGSEMMNYQDRKSNTSITEESTVDRYDFRDSRAFGIEDFSQYHPDNEESSIALGYDSESLVSEDDNLPTFFGRSKELGILRSTLLAVTSHSTDSDTDEDPTKTSSKHVWITGDLGIGKSSLVETFFQSDDYVTQQSFICRGSFEAEWMNTSKPFPGIVSCFSALFRQFSNGNEKEHWKHVIRGCLDYDDVIALLILLIPSLGTLLDVDTVDAAYIFEKRHKDSYERFSNALARILIAICSESTVIFFLDNVHCADDDSLRLLKDLLSLGNIHNFLFIGCHRRGINVSEPLFTVKEDLSPFFRADINMKGIDVESAVSIVRNTLKRFHSKSRIDTTMLAAFVGSLYAHSTCSNPLYLENLVHLLYEQKILKLNGNRWNFDSDIALPFSLEDLLLERMECLSTQHDIVLQGAALLNVDEFGTDSLMIAIATLAQSQVSGFEFQSVHQLDSILDSFTKNALLEERPRGAYAFAHDAIRTVALSRLASVMNEPRSRPRLHWRLGTNLRKLAADDTTKPGRKRSRVSLLIADHLNKGISAIGDVSKIERVVKLYIQLAEAAMKRAAFCSASQMLEIGIAAQKKSRWEDSYRVTLQSHLMLAQCYYCLEDLDRAKSLLNIIIANGNPQRDKIEAFDLLITIYRSNVQFEQAKQCALKALADIWEDDVASGDVEQKFKKVRNLVHTKSDADLLMLPCMDHKKTKKKMPFLLQLAEIAGLCKDYKLQDLTSLRMMELTLKYGSYESNFTGLAFALCGLCVERRHLHGEASRYGRLAEMMSEKDSTLGRQAIAHNRYSMSHWRSSLKDSPKALYEICLGSIEEGEVHNLSFQVGTYASTMFYTGTSFDSEDNPVELYDQNLEDSEFPQSWYVTAPYNALMKLRGDDAKLLKTKYSDTKAIQYDLFFQMVVSVFFYDIEKAQVLNEKIFVKPDGFWGSYRLFMEGLIETYFAQQTEGKTKFFHQREATKSLEILTAWAQKGMYSSAHMANILKVELMMASDSNLSAKRASNLVDKTILSAYQDGFPHHAALASERAGMFFYNNGEEELASKFLSWSLFLYREWGADAKVKQLESECKEYLDSNPPRMRCLQKSNSKRYGALMFSDAKLDRSTSLGNIDSRKKSEQNMGPRSHSASNIGPGSTTPGNMGQGASRPGRRREARSQSRDRRGPRDDLGRSSSHSKRGRGSSHSKRGRGSSHSKPGRGSSHSKLGRGSSHSKRRTKPDRSPRMDDLRNSSHHGQRRKIMRHKEIVNIDEKPDPMDSDLQKKPSLVRVDSWKTNKSTISNITDDFGHSRRLNRDVSEKKPRGKRTKPVASKQSSRNASIERKRKNRMAMTKEKNSNSSPSTPTPIRKKKLLTKRFSNITSPKPKKRANKVADAGAIGSDDDRTYLARFSVSDFDSSNEFDFGESVLLDEVARLSDCEEDIDEDYSSSSCSSGSSFGNDFEREPPSTPRKHSVFKKKSAAAQSPKKIQKSPRKRNGLKR